MVISYLMVEECAEIPKHQQGIELPRLLAAIMFVAHDPGFFCMGLTPYFSLDFEIFLLTAFRHSLDGEKCGHGYFPFLLDSLFY